MTPSVPDYLSPIQWHQAVAVSRQECARIFRDGGMPQDALAAFGLSVDVSANAGASWERVVDQIAAELCAHPMKRAA
jgi:hypothetical protein